MVQLVRAVLACFSLGACTGTSALAQDLEPPERYDTALRDRGGREWLAFSAGILTRSGVRDDPLESGPFFAVDGGYDLSGELWRIGVELGFAYSPHDVDGVDAGALDLRRVNAGARLSYHGEGPRPWARAGLFYRWNSDGGLDDAPYDQDGHGWYGGLGLDFALQRGASIGPFLLRYAGSEDDLVETAFGVGAQFRL